MLLDDLLDFPIRQTATKVQPTQKTRCCLKTTVNKLPYGLEVLFVVRKYRLTQVASDCRRRHLAITKTLVESVPACNTHKFLQIIYRQTNPADIALVNVLPQAVAKLLVLRGWSLASGLDKALVIYGFGYNERHTRSTRGLEQRGGTNQVPDSTCVGDVHRVERLGDHSASKPDVAASRPRPETTLGTSTGETNRASANLPYEISPSR